MSIPTDLVNAFEVIRLAFNGASKPEESAAIWRLARYLDDKLESGNRIQQYAFELQKDASSVEAVDW